MATATSRTNANKGRPKSGRSAPAAVPKGPKVLRIGVVQGGRIIEERIVRKRETVTVGHSERNHFIIPAKTLPARFELFELRGSSYFLTFTDDMEGRVSVPSGLTDFAQLKSSGKAAKKGQAYQVELTEESRGKVVIGDATLLFQFVTPPPIQPKPQLPAAARGGWVKSIDWPFVALVLVSFVLQFGFVIWLENRDWPRVEGWQNVPDRFASLLVEDVPTEEDIDRLRRELEGAEETSDEGEEEADEGQEEEQPSNTKSTGRSTSPEERAERAEAAARAAAERRARVTEAMSQVAMAKIIGSLGGDDGGVVSDVLRGGDVGGDMDEVMSQAKGVGVAKSGQGGVLRKVSGGSGDGAGGVADISKLKTSGGGNKSVESGKVGGERQVRAKMKRGNAAVTGGTGTLSGSEVRRVVSRAIGGIKACYERELRRNPTLGGRVTVRFTIGGGGRVVSASASNNTITPSVGSCIVARIRSLRFPPPEGGNVTFSYPFFFQPSQ